MTDKQLDDILKLKEEYADLNKMINFTQSNVGPLQFIHKRKSLLCLDTMDRIQQINCSQPLEDEILEVLIKRRDRLKNKLSNIQCNNLD